MSERPSVTQTILDGQIGIVNVPKFATTVVIGSASKGDKNKPVLFAGNQHAKVGETFGRGPAPQMAALIAAAGQDVVVIRSEATTPGVIGTPVITNPGTSDITVTGSPVDTSSIAVRFPTGGVIGTAGITLQYSLDGGANWSQTKRLGTATAFAIPDTSVSLNFSAMTTDEPPVAATVLATTKVAFSTTEPNWVEADLAAALAALDSYLGTWDYIQVVGECSLTEATALKSQLDIWAAAKTYTAALIEFRRRDAEAEDEADYLEAIQTFRAGIDSKRITIFADEALVWSPLDGWVYRRPATWPVAVRLASIDSARYEPGWVEEGPFGGALRCSISTDGNLVCHDERVSPGFHAAKFGSLTTYKKKGERVYCTSSPVLSPDGSDFYSFRMRRVMDIGCDTTNEVLTDEIQSTPMVNPDGTIEESEAVAIEEACKSRLHDTLIANGRATAAYSIVDRTNNVAATNRVRVKTRIRPRATIFWLEEEIGFESTAEGLAQQENI